MKNHIEKAKQLNFPLELINKMETFEINLKKMKQDIDLFPKVLRIPAKALYWSLVSFLNLSMKYVFANLKNKE